MASKKKSTNLQEEMILIEIHYLNTKMVKKSSQTRKRLNNERDLYLSK
jgi:hypothetical protein